MELETTLGIDLVAVEIADEVDVLIDLATAAGANAVRLTIRPADAVPAFTLWNDLPVRGVDDGVMVELGDLHAGERRQVLLGFEVPGRPELGAASICELDLRWLDLASMTEKVRTLPVNPNAVPRRRRGRRVMISGSAGSSRPSAPRGGRAPHVLTVAGKDAGTVRAGMPDERGEKERRRVARHQLGEYHERELRALLERVREGFAQLDAGEIDAFELDDLIHRYKRSAKELWRFCDLNRPESAVWMLEDARGQDDELDWWAAGEPRRRG